MSTLLGYSVLAGVLVTTIVLGAQVLRFELRSYRARRRAIRRQGFLADHRREPRFAWRETRKDGSA